MINSKFYIGVHKTKYPNDGYFGSGEGIKEAIKKYGKAAFQKEILFVFDNSEDAYIKESEIVTVDLVKSANCYNRHVGGFGKGIMVANALGLNNKNKPLDHMDKVRAGLKSWQSKRKERLDIDDNVLLDAYNTHGSINAAMRSLGSNSYTIKRKLSNLIKLKYGALPARKYSKTKTKHNQCDCGNTKCSRSTKCQSCKQHISPKHSDIDIINAWSGSVTVADVARKLGYKNPNSLGKTFNRIKKLKPY